MTTFLLKITTLWPKIIHFWCRITNFTMSQLCRYTFCYCDFQTSNYICHKITKFTKLQFYAKNAQLFVNQKGETHCWIDLELIKSGYLYKITLALTSTGELCKLRSSNPCQGNCTDTFYINVIRVIISIILCDYKYYNL